MLYFLKSLSISISITAENGITNSATLDLVLQWKKILFIVKKQWILYNTNITVKPHLLLDLCRVGNILIITIIMICN